MNRRQRTSLDEVRTESLLLRLMIGSDLDDLARMHADTEVMRTLGGPRSREQTRKDLRRNLAHWDAHGFGYWAAVDRESGEFAGRGGLRRLEIGGGPEVEVGYGFLTRFWGRGLASELARAAVRAAFDVCGLTDLVCFSLPENAPSRRVMVKAGFVYERDVIYAGLPHVLYRLTRGGRVDGGSR